MSKIRKISAVLMALVLVMCTGYFSLMSTTSAWFYNSGVVDSGDSFVFGDLSVDTSFKTKSEIVFDGATKFADKDEVLFDKVVRVDNTTKDIVLKIFQLYLEGKSVWQISKILTDEKVFAFRFGRDPDGPQNRYYHLCAICTFSLWN